MKRTQKENMGNKKEKGIFHKLSGFKTNFASILKLNLAVALKSLILDPRKIIYFLLAMFVLLPIIVYAGDVIVESGRVGIGAATLSEELDVVGNIEVEKNNEVFLNLKNTEANGREYALVSAGSAGGIGTGKFSIYDKTIGTSRLTVDTNGNVGIGTTGPGSKLVVVGQINATAEVIADGDSSTNRIILSADGGIELARSSVPYFDFKDAIADDYDFRIQQRGDDSLQFVGKPNKLMMVLNGTSGNVGIGTINPTEKLEVAGNIKATQLCIGFDCRASWPSGSGSDTDWVISGSNMYSAVSGNVGIGTIGTTAPSEKLDVVGNIEVEKNNEVFLNLKNTEANGREYALVSAGSAGGIGIGKFSIYDKTIGTSRLTVDTNGNVGVGTSSPGGRLDVVTSGANDIFRVGDDANVGLEMRSGTTLGTPYIDFSNDAVTDYDVRIILTGDDSLAIEGGNVGINTLVVGNGAGKIIAGTFDPVYDIDGIKYATYGLSSIGLREELKGVAKLDDETLSYTLDFNEVEQGSDAWLFWNVIGKSMDDLSALLTSNFDGNVWYIKASNSITFFGSKAGEVSFQLSAPRFDAEKYTNYATDDVGGIKI